MATDIVKITDLPEKSTDFSDGDLLLVSEYSGGVFTSKKKNAYNIRQVPVGNTIYTAQTVTDSLGTVISIPAGLNIAIHGINANGSYEIWPDGTMRVSNNVVIGASEWSGGPWPTTPFYKTISLTLAVPFIDGFYRYSATVGESVSSSFTWLGYISAVTAGSLSQYLFNNQNANSISIGLAYSAVGRWRA